MLKTINTPVRAAPRDEIEVSGQRVIVDAAGEEIAYVGYDEDAEEIARAVNAHAGLVDALRLIAKPAKSYDEAFDGDKLRNLARSALTAAGVPHA
jgi:hypothetical protein